MSCMKFLEIPDFSLTRFEKFISKDQSTGCWNWDGCLNQKGYDMFNINNHAYMSHRVAYTKFKNKIAAGKVLDHKCRNRKCVNPDHLREVSPKINALENSLGASAINNNRTHCKKGHEFTKENTRITLVKTGKGVMRQCRACAKVRGYGN